MPRSEQSGKYSPMVEEVLPLLRDKLLKFSSEKPNKKANLAKITREISSEFSSLFPRGVGINSVRFAYQILIDTQDRGEITGIPKIVRHTRGKREESARLRRLGLTPSAIGAKLDLTSEAVSAYNRQDNLTKPKRNNVEMQQILDIVDTLWNKEHKTIKDICQSLLDQGIKVSRSQIVYYLEKIKRERSLESRMPNRKDIIKRDGIILFFTRKGLSPEEILDRLKDKYGIEIDKHTLFASQNRLRLRGLLPSLRREYQQKPVKSKYALRIEQVSRELEMLDAETINAQDAWQRAIESKPGIAVFYYDSELFPNMQLTKKGGGGFFCYPERLNGILQNSSIIDFFTPKGIGKLNVSLRSFIDSESNSSPAILQTDIVFNGGDEIPRRINLLILDMRKCKINQSEEPNAPLIVRRDDYPIQSTALLTQAEAIIDQALLRSEGKRAREIIFEVFDR